MDASSSSPSRSRQVDEVAAVVLAEGEVARAALVVGAVGGRRAKRARLLAASSAPAGGDVTPALRAPLDDPVSRAASWASALLLLAVLALMVWKP
jgi:hypothetical protein